MTGTSLREGAGIRTLDSRSSRPFTDGAASTQGGRLPGEKGGGGVGKSEQGAECWERSEEGLAASEQRTAGGRVETRCGAQLGSDQGAVGTDGMWKEVTD